MLDELTNCVRCYSRLPILATQWTVTTLVLCSILFLFPLVVTLQQMALLSRSSSKNEASLAFHFNPTTLLTVQLGPEGSSQIDWELALLFSSGHSYEEFPDKGTIIDDTKGACLVISCRRWWTQHGSHSSHSKTIQFPCENKELMESTTLKCNYVSLKSRSIELQVIFFFKHITFYFYNSCYHCNTAQLFW